MKYCVEEVGLDGNECQFVALEMSIHPNIIQSGGSGVKTVKNNLSLTANTSQKWTLNITFSFQVC